MVFLEKDSASFQVFLGFPGIMPLSITFPLDKVSLTLVIQYPLDFVVLGFLWLILECFLERGVLVRGFQQRYMEHWVDFCVLGKVQFIVYWALLVLDQEWSDLDCV